MKYENTPNKLRHLWTKNKRISQDITFEFFKDEKNEKEIKIVNPKGQFIFNKFYRYESEWTIPYVYLKPIAVTTDINACLDADTYELQNTWQISHRWIITLNNFPERWIPHLKYAVITDRNVNHYLGTTDKLYNDFDIVDYTNNLIFVEDIEGSDSLKKVTIDISWQILSSLRDEAIEDFRAKIMLELYNPDFYE